MKVSSMSHKLNYFKAYDIRGRLGSEITEDIAYKIGRAYAEVIKPKNVVVGGDSRLSSEALKLAFSNGLLDSGVDVVDIGLSGTEEIYFSTAHYGYDGGVQITASHNPIDYNGMKLVSAGAVPISRSTGLSEIESLVIKNDFPESDDQENRGIYTKKNILTNYVQKLLSFIDFDNIKPLKLVINSGNGAAGHVIDFIEGVLREKNIPIDFIKINNDPDGTFPHGIPNPLLPDCRQITRDAVILNNADMGIAFDGDFDRCFFFDENGNFIEGYYIVGLLAEAFLQKNSGSKIIHDPRLFWNTVDVVKMSGGVPIQSKTGHAYIKEIMRSEDAIYGGEMSAHHYFRDFFYCDSGMIPWLLIAELVSVKTTTLSALVGSYIRQYPSSGEINCVLSNPIFSINAIKEFYKGSSISTDLTDGLSMEFASWRFNLRSSNTEPLVRLNVESRGDCVLMEAKTKEILHLLQG